MNVSLVISPDLIVVTLYESFGLIDDEPVIVLVIVRRSTGESVYITFTALLFLDFIISPEHMPASIAITRIIISNFLPILNLPIKNFLFCLSYPMNFFFGFFSSSSLSSSSSENPDVSSKVSSSAFVSSVLDTSASLSKSFCSFSEVKSPIFLASCTFIFLTYLLCDFS